MPAGGENATIARYFELPRSQPAADLKLGLHSLRSINRPIQAIPETVKETKSCVSVIFSLVASRL